MPVEKMCPEEEERRGQSGEWIEGEFSCDVPWHAWCTCFGISSCYSGSGGSAWRGQCRERVISCRTRYLLMIWRRRRRRESDEQCSVMLGHSQHQSFMGVAVSANIGLDV